jgi:hypothetical protein
MTPSQGLFYFAVAFALARLEIQIEGPHGWAEKLPTWRRDGPGVRKWLGKPVTGYHVWMLSVLLLLLHAPQVHGGFSWELEAVLLSWFALLTVCWDFLWFAGNPHFGPAAFRPGRIWWFPTWVLGLPQPYWAGLAASALLGLSPALAGGDAWRRGADWLLAFAEFSLLTAGMVVAGCAAARLRPLAAGK